MKKIIWGFNMNSNAYLYEYDKIISQTLTQLLELVQNGELCLGHFNPKDESHLYLFSIARMAQDIFGIKLTIDLKGFAFYWFIWRYHCQKKIIRFETKAIVNCPSFIENIQSRNPNFKLSDIYKEYYKK